MRIDNYLNITRFPAQISLTLDRTASFREVRHSHPGLEIIYVHEGCGHVVLNQQRYIIQPGTLLYYKPYQQHQVQMNINAENPYIRSMFLFEPALLWDYFKPFDFLVRFIETLWKNSHSPQVVQVPNPAEVSDYFSGVAARFGQRSNASYSMEENTLVLLQILHYLQQVYEHSNRRLGGSTGPHIEYYERISPAIKQILDWVEGHFSDKFELQTLARLVHLSPNHLSYLFRKETGTALSEYITSRRLRQAAMMLKLTEQPIRSIGVEVGFDNFSYFCKVFKEKFGITPSSYRAAQTAGPGITGELS
ncbi:MULTISPECIES: AraC family transcriptional regulator [unclassified Paenibacillus]|uniref:AraC family transcriptional regulator n=1 Tax=unclassified Paenibacillus TaxID=185978 RepID=UPI003639A9A8